jgi:hypothetical protein
MAQNGAVFRLCAWPVANDLGTATASRVVVAAWKFALLPGTMATVIAIQKQTSAVTLHWLEFFTYQPMS